MNNIYLVNEIEELSIKLDFNLNIFNWKDNQYKFEIYSQNEIKIYWSEDKIESYFTENSYLYFTNLELKNFIKMIFLVHSEWHDQAIINLKTNKLNRIKNKDQFGNFFLEENNLIIDWNYWGKEKYIKLDNNSYLQEDYQIKEYNRNLSIPIHIFIHICAIENWREIFNELLNEIKKSGLYEIITKIHLGILGDVNIINDEIFIDDKFNILYIDQKINLYENYTINRIKMFCYESVEEEIYILYLHTKGVRKAGNEKVVKSWRDMMNYFLVEKYKICLDLLSHYNTLGNNIVNSHIYQKNDVSISDKHTLHYSGNYWWAKKSYINNLPYLNLDFNVDLFKSRFKSENWILSNYEEKSDKFGILYQDDTNTHPYHRFVFDNYKNNNIIVKNILI